MVMMMMQMMFSTNPALIMSFIFMYPLAKTIALGGVPIGSILAQLAPKVMGMPSNKGSMCKEMASEEITGAITITCATLLITSLKNIEAVVTIKIINNVFSVE